MGRKRALPVKLSVRLTLADRAESGAVRRQVSEAAARPPAQRRNQGPQQSDPPRGEPASIPGIHRRGHAASDTPGSAISSVVHVAGPRPDALGYAKSVVPVLNRATTAAV